MAPRQKFNHVRMPDKLMAIVRSTYTPHSVELLRGARVNPQGCDIGAAAWILGVRFDRHLIAFMVEWDVTGAISTVALSQVVNYDPNTLKCILRYEQTLPPTGEMTEAIQQFAVRTGLI